MAGVSACAKFAGSEVSPWQVLFIQALIGTIIAFPLALREGLITKRPRLMAIRSIAGWLSFVFYFIALQSIPMVDDALLLNSAPMWVPVLGLIWLKIKSPWQICFGIIVGFIGVALVLQPDGSKWALGHLWGLLSGICMTIVLLSLRELSLSDRIWRIMFYYLATSALLSLPVAIALWTPLTGLAWLAIIGVALFGLCNSLFVVYSLQHGSAATLSPIYYIGIVFTAALDWIFWGSIPNWMSWLGALLIIGGGTWTVIAGRNSAARKER